MKAIQKLKGKLAETFMEKEHKILPDISDPKEQLLTIWTPENREDPVYPTMKKARTHSGTEELYYDLTVIIPVHNSGKYLHNCLYPEILELALPKENIYFFLIRMIIF